MAQEVEAAIV
jgi:hypothetical protein